MSEQTLSDLGTNMIRTQLVTVSAPRCAALWRQDPRGPESTSTPPPAGARPVGQDVALALATQNLILPAGTQKIGKFEYTMQLNNSPTQISGLADLPVKTVNGATIYCTTWRTCAMATRLRPISCTLTAHARSADRGKERRGLHARDHSGHQGEDGADQGDIA